MVEAEDTFVPCLKTKFRITELKEVIGHDAKGIAHG